ncbi:Transcriptional regulator, MarR family [Nostocoides japonicum T1-X7]|uniref:Transcriptional regulator, MarR family n=1 Tax=Nostocoides japonicum T1-X7 TaxID=1194083 RepID=A0A077M8H5_9MICO|nr:MarR family transcriptional regulator [Tetrasphaera japonica]CCH80354.1 Transcriptional regulator, MarR family [Tetrasphaera japonica T1-X7]
MPGVAHESSVAAARELLVAYGRLKRRLLAVSGRGGLSPSMLAVLSRLDRDGAMTTSGLAAVEGVRPQSMAATVAALDGESLVVRRPDPTDGRAHLLDLTAAGRDLLEGKRQERHHWLVAVLEERLDEAERQALLTATRILEKVLDE